MGLEEFLLDRARKEGFKEGTLLTNTSVTESLLKKTDFTAEKIANLAGVSVDFVKEIKSKMEA